MQIAGRLCGPVRAEYEQKTALNTELQSQEEESGIIYWSLLTLDGVGYC